MTQSKAKEKAAAPVKTGTAANDSQRGNHSTNASNGKADFGAHVHLEPQAIACTHRVLYAIMEHGIRPEIDLAPEVMPTPQLQTACQVIRDAAADGKRGLPEVIGHMIANTRDQGKQDSLRSIICDIAEGLPERPGALAAAVERVREYYRAKRLWMLTHRLQRLQDEGGDTAATIAEIAALANDTGGSESLLDRAYAIRFDPEAEPPPDRVLLSIGDVPVAAAGNLSAIQGKSKVGKSSTVSAVIAAALRCRLALPGDCLAFNWTGEDTEGAILHFDTEQSPADWHALVTRAVLRSGLPEAPDRLVSLPLVQFSRSERLGIIAAAIEREHKRRGVALVILDGVADICKSPNDEAEALELVSKLQALCHKFGTAIICVLHENPGSQENKTRGHLGSELNRKAFGNLIVEKDESGLSTIYGPAMRRQEIPKGEGYCFQWNDEARMHTYAGRAAGLAAAKKESEAISKARAEWEPLFQFAAEVGTNGACPEFSPDELAKHERDMNGTKTLTKTDAMKKRMQRAEKLGVLRKTKPNHWTLAPAGQSGQTRDNRDASPA